MRDLVYFNSSTPVDQRIFLRLEFRNFGAFDYSRTKDLTTIYAPMNPELSGQVHDQGTTYTCWAFSVTSMLRATWKRTLIDMKQSKNDDFWKPKDAMGNELFSDKDYNNEEILRKSDEMFKELRNLLMMTVIPKRLNKNDEKQGAYLRATIVRVSLTTGIDALK